MTCTHKDQSFSFIGDEGFWLGPTPAKERTLRAVPRIYSSDQADNDRNQYQAPSFCGDEGYWMA